MFIVLLHIGLTGHSQLSHEQAPRELSHFTFLNTCLDSDDHTNTMREGFRSLLNGVAASVLERSKAEMEASLQAVGV